jgi:phosphohistidine phosphatase
VRLVLVRHAEAAPGDPDAERPLTPAGREQARAVGERLAAEGLRPHAILASPLLRARQTADRLAAALGVATEADPRLGPGATADDVREAIAGRGDVVVVVGHQPDCAQIAATLGGVPEPPFPPAGTFAVELE